jgi:hypothetical protein
MKSRLKLSRDASKFFEDNYPRVNLKWTLEQLKLRVFSPKEVARLNEPEFISLSVIGVWRRLRRCSVPRAVIDIVSSLEGIGTGSRQWLLSEIGEIESSRGDKFDAAVASGALVVTDQPRTVHWKTHEVQVDWDKHQKCWAYMDMLVRATKRQEEVSYVDIGKKAKPAALKHRKILLKRLTGFPESLRQLIEPSAPYCQKLAIPVEMIRIFEGIGGGEYQEWIPTHQGHWRTPD